MNRLATSVHIDEFIHGYLRYGEEVDVIEHLFCLSILSAKDYHKHGVNGPIFFIGVNVSWA